MRGGVRRAQVEVAGITDSSVRITPEMIALLWIPVMNLVRMIGTSGSGG